MDLTKWLPLWEKCHELRIDGLTEMDGHWYGGMPLIDPEESSIERIPDSTVAALIRDKAVGWLVPVDKDSGVAIFSAVSLFAVCILPETEDESERHAARSVSDDLTESLYLACCKVLNHAP